MLRRYWLTIAISLLSFNASAELLDLSAYKGKVVYLDFWASWCGPCRQSFPWMNSLQSTKANEGLVILTVNLDQDRKLADDFLSEFSPAFKVMFDPDGTLASRYEVSGMPSSYIIGRDGKPRYKHIGFHVNKKAQYEQEIQSLLDEHPL